MKIIHTASPARRARSWIGFLLGFVAASFPVAVQPAAAQAPAGKGALEVVLVGKPARKTLALTTTQPARIAPLEQTPIHSKTAAYVGQVLVDYGDPVKQGQTLLQLTAPELEAALAQRTALLAKAKAGLVQAEAGQRASEAAVLTAQSRIVQAEAGIDHANTDIARWRSENARIRQLVTSGSINRQLADETQQKLGASEAALKAAHAAIEAAKAAANQAQAEAARAAADVAAAKAEILVAEQNMQQAKVELSYLTITAPFAGVIVHRDVDPGHFVQPAGSDTQPLLVLARIDKLRVFIAVPENDAAFVDVGDPVTLDLNAFRGSEIPGKVTRTGIALDPGSRSLTAIVDLDNNEGRLRPGMYATARIGLQEQKDALVLPAAAVVRQGKEAFCYRYLNGKATKTPLQVGIKVADEFEVVSGITENAPVILNKAASLKDGQAVEELKAPAKK